MKKYINKSWIGWGRLFAFSTATAVVATLVALLQIAGADSASASAPTSLEVKDFQITDGLGHPIQDLGQADHYVGGYAGISNNTGSQLNATLVLALYKGGSGTMELDNIEVISQPVPVGNSTITSPGFIVSDAGESYTVKAFLWDDTSSMKPLCSSKSVSTPTLAQQSFTNLNSIQPLSIDGQNYVTQTGSPVRFWGVNLVASYPSHQQADGLAANLTKEEVNLVRLHHDMRRSSDWNSVSGIKALSLYSTNSRDPDPNAWDRYDYLNAQLRSHGIYTAMSLHSTRFYMPGDVDILTTDAADHDNWMAAIDGVSHLSGYIDLMKMLPMIDERCAELMEEYTRNLLNHVNPYTGIAYKDDPQLLYIELMNEHSLEYLVLCGNRFTSTNYPAVSYFDTKLDNLWSAYCTANGIPYCNIYSASSTPQREARGDFLRGLDNAFFNRLKNVVSSLSCNKPFMYSNLWRGEEFQKNEYLNADVVEDHYYGDPQLNTTSFTDLFYNLSRTALQNKPYFVGELNVSDKIADVPAQAPYRNMLQLATSVYGSFNNWSGVEWFAWLSGDTALGNDGWSAWEERTPLASDIVGNIQSDGIQLDHFRTLGMMFKQGYVQKSVSPVTLYVDDPCKAISYPTLMAPKYQPVAGWQSIYSFRKAYGPAPLLQPTAPWMTTTPQNPLVSDTGEIRKDITRKQLTVAAPKAEAFSGYLDGLAPAGLKHLSILGNNGTATVVAVSGDGNDLSDSNDIIVSKTGFDANNVETNNMAVALNQVKPANGTYAWYMKRTRPRGETGYVQLDTPTSGVLTIPAGMWNECELQYALIGSLPVRQSATRIGDTIRTIYDDTFHIAGVLGTSQGGFTFNSTVVGANAVTPAEGSKYLRLKLNAGLNPVVIGMNFTTADLHATLLNFIPFKNTAGLHFWIYAKTKVPSLSIELACDNNGKTVETRVPLTNYLADADYGNKWVEVTVPFTAFSDTGTYYDSSTGETTSMPFLWDKVKGIGFYCSTLTSGYYEPYADDIRVVYTSVPPLNQ